MSDDLIARAMRTAADRINQAATKESDLIEQYGVPIDNTMRIKYAVDGSVQSTALLFACRDRVHGDQHAMFGAPNGITVVYDFGPAGAGL